MSTSSGKTNGGGPAWPNGWPDVATLERLANEIFSSPPGVDQISSSANPLAGVSHELKGDVPLQGVGRPAISLPGEAELQALLSSIPSAPASITSSPFYF